MFKLVVKIVDTDVYRVNSAETTVSLFCPTEVLLFNSTWFGAFIMNIAFHSTVKHSVHKRKAITGLYIYTHINPT